MVTKVTDLGIAKATDTALEVGNAKAVLGTPYFMAPEQMISSNSVDHRADIYSLGASLYEFTTGKKPFHQKASLTEILKTGREKERPIPPEEHVKGFPEKLAGIINCSMAFEPNKRYAQIDHFLKDLKSFMDSGQEGLNENMKVTEEVSSLLDTSGTFLYETKSLDQESPSTEPKKKEPNPVEAKEEPKKKKKKPKLNLPQEEAEKPKKKRWLGCLFLVLMGLCLGFAYYLWQKNSFPFQETLKGLL